MTAMVSKGGERVVGFPYGTFCCSYSGSTEGYPPLLNPKIGRIFETYTSESAEEYCRLTAKLVRAIDRAVPAGTERPFVELRAPCCLRMSAAFDLSYSAFVLGEACPEHPLLRIATVKTLGEYREAVDALETRGGA